jgi:hypothetical protein
MSIKKIISLSILLLANVVILAKPVVCYYQDTLTECVANQAKDCCKQAKQDNCSNTKSTQKSCDTQKCVLKNLFLQESNNKLPKPVFNSFNIITDCISDYQIIQISNLTLLPFQQKPYVPLIYSNFISQSFGLRAPPAC